MSLLLLSLLVPTLAAVLLPVLRTKISGAAAAWLGVAASLIAFLSLVGAWLGRDGARWAGEVDVLWVEPLGVRFHLGLDGISYPLALLTTALSVLVCLWLTSGERHDGAPTLVALCLVIAAACVGVFAALDLILFFLFFELALIPMWFVIAWWGDPHDVAGRRRAATRFLIFTVAGSALMLVGFVIVSQQAGTLQIPELMARPPAGGLVLAAAILIVLGLAVKTPLVPVHIWLPDAHASAPTVGSVLLAGVFLKLGSYGLIRIGAQSLPDPMRSLAPYLAVVAVIGIIYSGFACYAQTDLKRLIAYSSIAHMGFVVLGLATMSEVGLMAAVYGSVAHGLITGLLFFVAGAMKDRRGSATFAAIGRGLYVRAPRLAIFFAFAAIASLGLPGLAGFWGELLSLRAAYGQPSALARPLGWTLLVIAALGIVLASAYFVRAIRWVCQGGGPWPGEERDLATHELAVVGLLALAVLVLGVYPEPLIDLIGPDLINASGGAP